MKIPSQPRRSGARRKPEHFSYEPTDKGAQYEGYLAGPIWWGPIHMTKPSKPCVWELTGGKVQCRFCRGPKPVAETKGWVPIYRARDLRALCVPVGEELRDELDRLDVFTKIVIGREKGKGAGVWIRRALSQEPKWSSTLPERMNPVDVTESLIKIWNVSELWEFFAGAPAGGASDTALSPPEAGKPVASWNRFVALGSVGQMEGNVTAAADRNEEFTRESRNGKHRKRE